MDIWIKPYRKRDGEVMFFINNERRVSVGISKGKGYQSSKATEGEKKLWAEFCEMPSVLEPIADGADMAKHDGEYITLFNGITIALTDTAEVGGVSVKSDGVYLVKEGRIYSARYNGVD